MKEELYNEKELKALEDEIRSLGIPYSLNEPDERYFANFRVRLMERIDAKQEKKSVFASLWSWLAISPIRSLSLGAGLVAIAAAALLINPANQSQVARVQPVGQAPVVAAPPPVEIPQITQNTQVAPKAVTHKVAKNTNIASKTKTNSSLDEVIKGSDLASMDETITSGESDGPVNIENLSEADLESVVQIAQGMH